jgi:hypothetical protein
MKFIFFHLESVIFSKKSSDKDMQILDNQWLLTVTALS